MSEVPGYERIIKLDRCVYVYLKCYTLVCIVCVYMYVHVCTG